MSCNFKIDTHQKLDTVYIRLLGDFDGDSAYKLINNIKTCSKAAKKVFIHTDGLKDIHPFGKAVFRNNFHEVNKQSIRFIFMGKNGKSLAPWKNS